MTAYTVPSMAASMTPRFAIRCRRSRRAPARTTPACSPVPTCDSIDIIDENLWLPELQIGDLLVGSLMGAYTMGSASEFNSIPKTKILVVNGPETTT